MIENLEYSKKLSNEIAEKVAVAKVTEVKINETSEKYRPAAIRGALFYFMLSEMPKIHSFYKYSLETFIVVINRAIDAISEDKMYPEESMIPYTEEDDKKNVPEQEDQEGEEGEKEEKPEENKENEKKEEKPEGEEGEPKEAEENKEEPVEEEHENKKGDDDDEPVSPRSLNARVNALIESLTYNAYQYTRRGLFERHKLTVATMLTFRILLRDNKLDQAEVDHLIIGKTDPAPPPIPEPLKSFVNDTIWSSCVALQHFPTFATLCHSLETDVL